MRMVVQWYIIEYILLNSSTKLPVTHLNEAPSWGADSNLHGYNKKVYRKNPNIYLDSFLHFKCN